MIESNTAEHHNAGFRLQYLEVLNWGTFDKVRWQIRPNGYNALLTGDIGSGKSTLVDALTCLLVPHNKIVFNKAAGAEGKERNLLSYVKGEFKKEKEELTKIAKKVYLRPNDNTYTVIIGNFHNEGYQEDVCLAQVFWIGKDGKVEKLLLISSQALSITQHFNHLTDINELRKKLRNTPGVQIFNDNFSQYSEQFRRLFGMNSDKAIELFYQTVSMKSVSSLTDFVREQMLERTDVKDQIASLLKRFDDLNKAHAAVVHAREQHQILKPLTEASKEYDRVSKEIENLERMVDVIPGWFAQQKQLLLDQAIAEATQNLHMAEQMQQRMAEDKTTLDEKRIGILQDIDRNGGKRLEQIGAEIIRQEREKVQRKKEFDAYDRLLRLCDLKTVQQEADFLNNITLAKKRFANCTQKAEDLRQQRDAVVSELRREQDELAAEQKELKSLLARKTQIPAWLVGFRSQLCQDLRIDETDLPFVGELLKVNPQESAWEGAIEKLLRDAGISLLVSQSHYRSVSKYVNDNTLRSPDGRGIKLSYLEVADQEVFTRGQKELELDSICHKIDIKPDTPFLEWLEAFLQRSFGAYLCVNVADLQRVPFGITQQGLIKSGRIRHTKDDRRSLDDRRNYVLGWSNLEKIRVVQALIAELEHRVEVHHLNIERLEQESSENDELKQQLAVLLSLDDYAKINWQANVETIHQLQQEREALQKNNNQLDLLSKMKAEVEAAIQVLTEAQNAKNQEIGGLKTNIQNYQTQAQAAEAIVRALEPKLAEHFFPLIATQFGDKKLSLNNLDQREKDFSRQYQGENGELKKLRSRQTSLRSAIERKIREIKEHSKAEYSEIAESIEARAEYGQKFIKLSSEDLKRHEARFKDELNKNTINSIAVFDNQLRKHEEDIEQKIKTINQHLYEIVYNAAQDTYITIQMDKTPNKEVRLFREELKACYAHSFSQESDLYSEEKYEQVKKILDRFASADSSDKEWTSTVSDVRQWFEFNASERYRADQSEKEFYEGSGGKSGGQKEKLAYTILASALAYQFGLQFGESKSRSFRFVVIDEAFGRGSDESTRYGLELFKKLNLQLLIVTPLQKIHIIESHVNSFHFVSNREGNNSQVSNFNKAEYAVEKARFLQQTDSVS